MSHPKTSDVSFHSTLSSYPFSRRLAVQGDSGNPENALYSHNKDFWSTSAFQCGSFWYNRELQPRTRCWDQSRTSYYMD